MSPALVALLALVVALAVSMTSRVNVGLLAISLAWMVGVYVAALKPDVVIAGFPATLFITLAGVTLLFSIAGANGTLEILAWRAAGLVRGNAALIPLMFFALAFLLSSIGPGAVASVALVAPLAMPTGRRAGVPNFVSAVMVGTGANAGNLSPVSSVGAMVNTLMASIGLPGHAGRVWAANFVVHLLVALIAWAVFGGLKLLRSGTRVAVETEGIRLERRHWITIVTIGVWMIAVVGWRMNVGLAAFTAATVLLIARVADEGPAIRGIPLGIIFMVCGVTMLIAVLETTGGLALFTGLIARLATPATLNGVIAFVTGIVSTYSSTSGVVLPAFLPMVPGLVQQVGGGEPLAVAISINVGSALVDVSPLSTLGALCLAAVPDPAEARVLFRQLLIWGLSMAVVGALLCGIGAGIVARGG
jgi:di/tricarboxylate transporter